MPGQEIVQISGTGLPYRGNDVDTDRYVPARFLKEVTFSRMGEHLFEDERAEFREKGLVHPCDDPRYKGANFMIVERNSGCGSSREHAPQAAKRFGIDFMLGKSFAKIFRGNCTSLGIPTLTAPEEVIDALLDHTEKYPDTRYVLDLKAKTLSYDGKVIQLEIPDTLQSALVTGQWDSLGMLLDGLDIVRRKAADIPFATRY